jgi:hypothetical protein
MRSSFENPSGKTAPKFFRPVIAVMKKSPAFVEGKHQGGRLRTSIANLACLPFLHTRRGDSERKIDFSHMLIL